MRRRHRTEDEAEINITPMLDVVFIMLIFFIVTTSFVKESGIDVSRPSNKPNTTETKKKNIVLIIDERGEVQMRGRTIDLRAVRANIEREHAENPEGTVVIVADSSAHTGILVEVMDQIKLAGVEAISVAAQRK